MKIGIILGLAVIGALALAACGGDDAEPTATPATGASPTVTVGAGADTTAGDTGAVEATNGARIIEIRTGFIDWRPPTIELTAGERVQFNLDVNGNHTFTVPDLGIDIPLQGMAPELSEVITAPAPGTYPFHCSFHGSRGMVGEIIVK